MCTDEFDVLDVLDDEQTMRAVCLAMTRENQICQRTPRSACAC